MAYLLTVASGNEKSLVTLLIGAAISGAAGGFTVVGLRYVARIREDAALGIVLSVFFGAGVALMSIAQRSGGNAAGLEGFIYGKAAAMTMSDVWLTGMTAGIVVGTILLFNKELSLLCFDSSLAQCQGWPVALLDGLLIALVVSVTIVGLQAVGLILMISLLVVPAASARFWTNNMNHLQWISAVLGGSCCVLGTLTSALPVGGQFVTLVVIGTLIIVCAVALTVVIDGFSPFPELAVLACSIIGSHCPRRCWMAKPFHRNWIHEPPELASNDVERSEYATSQWCNHCCFWMYVFLYQFCIRSAAWCTLEADAYVDTAQGTGFPALSSSII